MSVLRHSTKFTWTRSGSLLDYKNDLTKKIQLKEIFNNTEYEDESILRNNCARNFETKSRELSLIATEIENLTPNALVIKAIVPRRIFCITVFKRISRHSV